MPTLSPLAIGRPAWTSTAEQRLWSLLHSGHPAPVDTLVAELADTLHITVEQARREVEHHLDLTGLINQGPTGASTPLVRTVGQTPKASLLAWGSPPESPKTPKAVFAPGPEQVIPDRPPCREPRRRARTEGYMKVSFSPGENGESPQELRVEVTHSDRITVAVIAPGAGTGINGAIYSELGRNPSFKVEVVGRSRAQYDVYPPCWPHGAPAPNLQTFAEEVLETRVHERVRCMVFGSRGGQVLPQMWQAQAQGVAHAVPPVVVINGGCAMKLPTPKIWPDKQVLFALIGGKDNFRGHLSIEDYITETRSHVPANNKTTAILFVKEMTHMPQQHLLRGLLGLMLKSLATWKEDSKIPLELFRKILSFLRKDGWSGILLYTTGPMTWEEITFSPHDIDKMQVEGIQPHEELPAPMEFTAKDEVKALWKAAVVAATAPKRCHDKAEQVSFGVPKLATAALRASEGLQVPARTDMGYGTPDATPISRTLGLQARPRGFSSGYSTPQSNHSSVSPRRVFFVESPKHLGIPGVA